MVINHGRQRPKQNTIALSRMFFSSFLLVAFNIPLQIFQIFPAQSHYPHLIPRHPHPLFFFSLPRRAGRGALTLQAFLSAPETP